MSLDWPRVTEIVAEAIGRDLDRRLAYLADVCDGNDELGAEVTALLAAHDQAGGFLAESAVVIGEPEAPVASENVGRKLGPYLVEDTLGEGGMGVVLLAEDTRTQTRVTLKTLPPMLARDAALRDYLERETQVVAAMGHPNIATVHTIEEVYGQFYVVSEYVPGSTLRALIDAGPIEPEMVAAIGLQVAEALAAGHSIGTSHRDLKPENIVCGQSGVVKVLDFGLMRTPEAQAPGAQPNAAELTGESPAYMSPEQLDGPSVDSRSDLFSLGVVMYEMAVGRNPFAAPTPAATAVRVKTAHPPPPSTVRANIPPALDRVIARCLEKDRDTRYQKAGDLVHDLHVMLEEQPAAPRQPARAAKVRRPEAQAPVSSAHGAWAAHQLLVMAIYAVSAYLMWRAEQESGGAWSLALLVVMIAAAAVSSVLRTKLLTTERLGAAEYGVLHRRTGPVISGLDWLAVLVLLTMAFSMAWSYSAMAITLGALGIGLAIVSIAVEPTRTRAAFSGMATPPSVPPPAPRRDPAPPPPQSS